VRHWFETCSCVQCSCTQLFAVAVPDCSHVYSGKRCCTYGQSQAGSDSGELQTCSNCSTPFDLCFDCDKHWVVNRVLFCYNCSRVWVKRQLWHRCSDVSGDVTMQFGICFRVPWNAGKYFSIWGTISVLGRAVLHAVCCLHTHGGTGRFFLRNTCNVPDSVAPPLL